MSYGLMDIARDTLANNIVYSEDELKQRRIAICRSCVRLESSVFDNIGKCSSCGCLISHKTRYYQTNCPEDKW